MHFKLETYRTLGIAKLANLFCVVSLIKLEVTKKPYIALNKEPSNTLATPIFSDPVPPSPRTPIRFRMLYFLVIGKTHVLSFGFRKQLSEIFFFIFFF